MKVATRPELVWEMLSDSSDFDEKLVETRLGLTFKTPLIAPVVAFRSWRVIPDVTPNDPSTFALVNTVARLPPELAVTVWPAFFPGSCETPATRPAAAPVSQTKKKKKKK